MMRTQLGVLFLLGLLTAPVRAADVQLDTEANPSTPASGSAIGFFNVTNKEWQTIDDGGNVKTVRTLTNANTADVTASSADTYLTGSAITIPTQLVRTGTRFRWTFAMSKTNVSTAAPVWTVRVGTTGTTSDTGVTLTFTGVAQTAAVDNGFATIEVIVRASGASGTLEGVYSLTHVGNTAGLANAPVDVKQTTSGTVALNTASLIFGVSCNPAGTAVWTFQHVSAEATNL